MDLTRFFDLFFGFFKSLVDLLGSYSINAFGVSVSLLVIIGSMIVLSMIVALFWKGAKG